jgi:hypothetical protein
VFRLDRMGGFAVEIMLLYCHAGFYLRSFDAIWGFARFAWRRKKDLPFVRQVMRDMFFTPDVAVDPTWRETRPAAPGAPPPREAVTDGPERPGRVT